MTKYVAIIGAGIAGLTAIKQCLDNDLIPICFEQNSFIGGLWRYENCEKNKEPYSTIYKGVLTNTSKEMSTFSDFPIPAEWPSYLNQTYVEKYIDMYAENFNLLPHIKFNTTVLKISILPDKRWKVKYIIQNKNQEKEEIFDYIMVCSGHHTKPKWPEFKGMNFFKGEQLHSYKYKRAIDFENKRVLVVGGSFSAMDIAVELSNVASQVYISIRSGKLPWIIPRFMNGKATDHFTRFDDYIIPLSIKGKFLENFIIKSFPTPSYVKLPTDPLISSPIIINSVIFQCLAAGTIIVKPNIKELKSENNQIEFIDGSFLENIDVIIYSTGYSFNYPFLEKNIYTGGDEIEQVYGKDFHDIVWLYNSIFPPKYPNIAFIGLTNRAGSLLPICFNLQSEMQARYATSLFKGSIKPLPSQNEMEISIRKYYEDVRKMYCKSARSGIRYNYLSYMDALSKEVGCYPHPYEIFKKFGFNFWKLFMFGMATPIQYRLIGRGSWEGAKDAISLYNEYSLKNSTRGSREMVVLKN
ncbi:flavin monooxygenase-like protein [Gigaspora rosea]|uniref:Flavin-containing monooxygenase 1 n=1 Tax=Gigaspora rosea TaxID=44941 RepID=A0A397UZJ6_9GLOM|nr:flavin monooxygenase-like protein [Gigaspora rosea]